MISFGPGMAYSRLLKLQQASGTDQPSLLLECDLCASWQLTQDFAYEFELRPGVKWQDIAPVNGRELVADDLVFSYNRLRTPDWPHASLFASFGEMEAMGPHRLRVNLAVADADALLALADGHSKIVAREVVEQFGSLQDSPVVGTGPWIWSQPEGGASTRLTRNPAYFEPGLPFLEELEIMAMSQAESTLSDDRGRLAAFQAGLVDLTMLPPREWQELQASGTFAASALSMQSGTGVLLTMNVQAPPLTELQVRRAILRALDPWNYLDTIWSGQGFVSVGIPVQSPEWLLDRNEMRGQHFADPGAARAILAGTAIAQHPDLQLTIRTEDFGEVYLDMEQRLADELRQIGFNPVIRRLNPSQFNETVLNQKDYQLAVGLLPPTSTTNSFLMALLHSEGRWNIASHQDEQLDRMIERQAREFDPTQRREQLLDIQRRVLDQAYLFSPVTGASRWVFNRDVRGFQPNTALSEYLYWSRVWLDR